MNCIQLLNGSGQQIVGYLALGLTSIIAAVLVSSNVRSIILGKIDDITAFLGSRGKSNFRLGVGQASFITDSVNATSRENTKNTIPTEIKMGKWVVEKGFRYADCSFPSPISPNLSSKEAKVHEVHFQIVLPGSMTLEEVVAERIPISIHLPSTGDEYFGLRRKLLATPLATNHKIVSILMMLPYYGHRRCSLQSSSALMYIHNLSEQSLAAVMESNAVINWLTQKLEFQGSIVLTGFSFGASMSALASLYCHVRHAVVSFIPANGPKDAYVNGALDQTVPFHLFGNGKAEVDELLTPMDIAKDARMIYTNTEESNLQPERVYYQVTAKHDKYIPHHSALHMYEHMQKLPKLLDTKLIEIEGGHASAILFFRGLYIDTILKSIEVLEGKKLK